MATSPKQQNHQNIDDGCGKEEEDLLNATVSEGDLPCMRSTERIADCGHVIGKLHVAEVWLQSQNWGLHTDGTSQSGKKFVGYVLDGTGWHDFNPTNTAVNALLHGKSFE